MTYEDRKTVASQSGEISEAEIDMTLADSFPASDPPSWTLGIRLGRSPIQKTGVTISFSADNALR